MIYAISMKDNERNKIDEALSHIKKTIIEKDLIEGENIEKNDYILLDKIVSNKNKKIKDKENLRKKKPNKKNNIIKDKSESSEIKLNENKYSLKNKKEGKSKIIKKNKEKNPVDDLVNKEVKPIIKKWIDKNLRIFVKNIVIEEMKAISKATQKPNNK